MTALDFFFSFSSWQDLSSSSTTSLEFPDACPCNRYWSLVSSPFDIPFYVTDILWNCARCLLIFLEEYRSTIETQPSGHELGNTLPLICAFELFTDLLRISFHTAQYPRDAFIKSGHKGGRQIAPRIQPTSDHYQALWWRHICILHVIRWPCDRSQRPGKNHYLSMVWLAWPGSTRCRAWAFGKAVAGRAWCSAHLRW